MFIFELPKPQTSDRRFTGPNLSFRKLKWSPMSQLMLFPVHEFRVRKPLRNNDLWRQRILVIFGDVISDAIIESTPEVTREPHVHGSRP